MLNSPISTREGLIFDSCCLINFNAAERTEAVLTATCLPCFASFEVSQEIPTFSWNTLADASLLSVVELDANSDEESNLYIQLLIEGISDGEASCAALAALRNWALVTDDKSAIRLCKRYIPDVPVLTTPDLLKHWVERENVSAIEMAEVIEAIRMKGRYAIPSEHHLRSWWGG